MYFNMVGPFFISCDFLPKTNPTPGLEPEYVTLAEHLKSEGYTNHLVGKWHLGQSKVDPVDFYSIICTSFTHNPWISLQPISLQKKYHPLRRGFDTFYGLLGAGFNHWTKQQGGGR